MNMKKIIIVSNDVCAIKQIVNTINKIKSLKTTSINIYDIKDFKSYIKSSHFKELNTIYFIDIYNIEQNFLDLLQHLNKKDKLNKTIIMNNNQNLKILLDSQISIYAHLEKDYNFKNKILDILLTLTNNTSYKLNISKFKHPILVNKKDINNIYKWPNKKISINYKNGDNTVLISMNNASDELRHITKNNFYTDYYQNSIKRTHYSEPLKQLLTDLYLIYKIDPKILSHHFNIDYKYIKKWAGLSKYNRKINFIKFILGKIIVKSYLNKHKGSE